MDCCLEGVTMYAHKPILRLLITSIFVWLSVSTSSIGADTISAPEDSFISKPPSFTSTISNNETDHDAACTEPAESEPAEVAPFDILPPEDYEEPEPEKYIIISLADQRMFIFENGSIIHRFLVSTGVPGHSTPTGNYSVHNQALRAWSNKYECYMPHWSAITPDGLYGMHSLDGTSYLSHLGSVASHGCIRLSPEDATWLYDWVDIGTPVDIVADFEEPPEEKAIEYRLEKHYCF